MIITDMQAKLISETFVSWKDLYDQFELSNWKNLKQTIEDVYILIDAINVKDYFLKEENYEKCHVIQTWINSNLHVLQWIIDNPHRVWTHFYEICDDSWTQALQDEQLLFFKSELGRATCSHTETEIKKRQSGLHMSIFNQSICVCKECGCCVSVLSEEEY